MLLMMFQQSDIDEILKIPLCMPQISGSLQLETGVELKIPNKIKVFVWRALTGILPSRTKLVQKK